MMMAMVLEMELKGDGDWIEMVRGRWWWELFFYLLVNWLLSLNDFICSKFFPYVYEPNPSLQICWSNGHWSIAILQLTLNVAGPLQVHLPWSLTATSVTNLLGPPAKLIWSSPLERYTKYRYLSCWDLLFLTALVGLMCWRRLAMLCIWSRPIIVRQTTIHVLQRPSQAHICTIYRLLSFTVDIQSGLTRTDNNLVLLSLITIWSYSHW